MKISTLLLATFLVSGSGLNAQNFEWANSMGSSEFDLGKAITVDASGNSYSTGVFRQTVDFDPSAGVLNLTSSGLSDGYVQKLDADENLVWAKSFGGSNYVSGNAIAVDATGNVYVTGHFFQTADFDPGPGVFNMTSAGNEDVFVLKLDPNGDFLWAKRFGNTDDDVARSVAIDVAGNVCVTGLYILTVDFDPGPGVAELTSVNTVGPWAANYTDVFVLKLSQAGEYIWAKSVGGLNSDMPYGIDVDEWNDIYVTGHYRDTADFDPGIAEFNSVAVGQYDIFVLKLDGDGEFLWMKSIGSADNDEGYAVVSDGAQGVYITGYFSGTADFDPSVGVHDLTSNGAYDIFVLKLYTDGNLAWANSMGSTGSDIGTSVAVNSMGEPYITGQYYGTVDFDPGVGTYDLTSNGDADIFVQKLTDFGAMDWTITEGGTGNDIGKGITALGMNTVHLNGGFQNAVDFDFEAPVFDLTSIGMFDIYNQKISVTSGSLGLGDLQSTISIQVYPNPTTDHLTISSEEAISSAKVINMNGQIVLELDPKTPIKTIDVSGLSKGTYSLQLVGTENSWTQLISIQR